MRILLSFAHGLRATVSEPRLALALWGWSALLTLPVAAPIWRVWRDATADAPRADALIEQASAETDRAKRKALYYELQALAIYDAPAIFTAVTAAPVKDESNTRRSALPSVVP